VDRIINPTHETNIGVVGKYIELQDAYKSIYESLTIAGAHHDTRVKIHRIDAQKIAELLSSLDKTTFHSLVFALACRLQLSNLLETFAS